MVNVKPFVALLYSPADGLALPLPVVSRRESTAAWGKERAGGCWAHAPAAAAAQLPACLPSSSSGTACPPHALLPRCRAFLGCRCMPRGPSGQGRSLWLMGWTSCMNRCGAG